MEAESLIQNYIGDIKRLDDHRLELEEELAKSKEGIN